MKVRDVLHGVNHFSSLRVKSSVYSDAKSEMRRVVLLQPHLVQCYSRSRRIALISCGAHESEIYFKVQLGVNYLVLSREK